MDDLSRNILNRESGCVLGGTKINHIFYADDLMLISPSLKGLQNLINKCIDYFRSHYLTLNAQKNKVIIFKPKNFINYSEPRLFVNETRLEVVKSLKYLGMHINDELRDDEHITSLYRGQCFRSNTLIRNFHMCNKDAKINLFKSFCTSVYCIPLSLECKQETLQKLKVCYNNSLRFFYEYRVGLYIKHNCSLCKFKNTIF